MKMLNNQNLKQLMDINNRKIVVHHTHLINDIMSLLKDNDIVFFDDCLYSQYLFIQKHIKELQLKNIICVLGFSTKLYRTNQIPIVEDSAILHERYHSNDNDSLGGFMSLDELRDLLSYDNIIIAGHGAKHLELNKMNLTLIQQSQLFAQDISIMTNDLKTFGFQTNVFVFPYTYDQFPCAKKIIYNAGFSYIFAASDSQRIEIESLAKH